jgi:membrane protease YdiL (CAAX protease family)
VAGALGFGALLAFLAVTARLVHLPPSEPIRVPAEMPAVTAFLLLVMASIVAGVTEEAAFRGYMQGMIERRHGVVLAVIVSGALFGLLHFPNHPADVFPMLPYYVAVSAVYGGLTWAADSILPALVLHSAGDVIVLTRWWLTGRPEWQVGSTPPPLIWEEGVDLAFGLSVAAAVGLALMTAQAYRGVRALRVQARSLGRGN